MHVFLYANTKLKVTYTSETAEWLEPVIVSQAVIEITNRLYVQNNVCITYSYDRCSLHTQWRKNFT